MLNKGDTCYIRSFIGIEKCTYGYVNSRVHTVFDSNGNCVKVSRLKPKNLFMGRFVCMTGMRKEYVEAIQ